ncbi:hypothetical protein GCM10009616_01170 [Microlunatus lacustris]
MVLLIGALVAGTPQEAAADTAPASAADPATPVTVSDDALPAPQINGVVWTQAMVGNTVYAGGSFTNARPAGSAAGQNTVARGNLLAFDVTTGVLTSFAPSFNAQIRSIAVSPDQTRLYVGGEFTSVNGQTRRRIAAFDARTGALVDAFAPPVNYDVDALVATNTKVFAGGSFLGVGSAGRQYLAAFNAANGALLDWAPQATGGTVSALTINPDGTRVVAGGSFTAMNGSSNPGYGLAMLDTTTGASLPFAVNQVVRNGTVDGAITTLSTDGTYVYGGGYTFGKSGGTYEGTFAASWNAGEIHFLNDCHGDTYSVVPIGEVVYQVGHTHYCDNIDGVRQGAGGVGDYPYYRATAMSRAAVGTVTYEPDQGRYYSFLGQPAPAWQGWYPDINAGTYTGQAQGAWSVAGNGDYVVAGGEFTRVNGISQQGLVRFAVPSKAPNKSGPKLFSTTYPLNVSSTEAGSVRVNWMGNNDDDNENLTYRLYRDSQTAGSLKQTVTKRIRRWETVTMGFTDTGLVPGSSHQYRVVVSDPFGNVANSPWTTVTVAGGGADSPYVKAVYGSQPTSYWRLGEAAGTVASADRVGFMPLSAAGTTGAVRGAPGAVPGDADKASTFTGVNTSWTATAVQHHPPDVLTLEAWFKTTVAGGRIAGWSTRNTQGNSPKHDRQLYVDTAGKINFGARPTNQRLVVTSPAAVNDGQWHHAVGTLSQSGMKLYLDGEQVAARSDVTVGEHLNIGYWRIGGDTVSGWPNAGLNGFFNGSIDEVAVYKHELSAAEIADHFAKGASRPAPNVKPVASFTASSEGRAVSVDAKDSSDADGTVSSYAWDFGDGGTATGVTASHTYATSGAKSVKLTVTDDDGATATVTRTVELNAAPVADFTTSVVGQRASFDASGSTDAEGPIAGYAWKFGDGATGTGATPEHDYASGGSFEVTLTVTDGGGATHSVTKPVTVQAANQAPVAGFTTAAQGLVLSVDAASSSDADGTVDSYSWSFGDGATGDGRTAQHTYGAAGTYDVQLTITDDDGATTRLTKAVTVSAAVQALAQDAFARTVSNGWGSADTGGAWTVTTGAASNYSVSGGAGRILMAAKGASRSIGLNAVSSGDTEVRTVISADKVPAGGSLFTTVRPRVRNGNSYFADVIQAANGTVSVRLGREIGTTETVLQTRAASGLTLAAGDRLNFRVQATGISPTTLRAKVWRVGTAEPTAWTGSIGDTTETLQGAGALAVDGYLSSAATNAPVVVSFAELWAGAPQ